MTMTMKMMIKMINRKAVDDGGEFGQSAIPRLWMLNVPNASCSPLKSRVPSSGENRASSSCPISDEMDDRPL